MNGAHDMGGSHGFGPVLDEEDEPVFHAHWEARVLALTLAAGAGGRWNIDMSRFAREDTAPTDYLTRSYYETWLYGLQKLIVQEGLVTAEEVAAALDGGSFDPVSEPRLTAARVEPAMTAGRSNQIDVDVAPRFAVGQTVRAGSSAPRGHTRLPRYVRGHAGMVDRDHGVFSFPDTNAHGGGPKPQHVYSVRFDAGELWGADSQGGAVYMDLWDDHLEPIS